MQDGTSSGQYGKKWRLVMASELGGMFSSRLIPQTKGRPTKLRSGDQMYLILQNGTVATYGFTRNRRNMRFIEQSGKSDDKHIFLELFESKTGLALQRAVFELVALIGTICALPYQRRIRNDKYRIVWEFYREEPK